MRKLSLFITPLFLFLIFIYFVQAAGIIDSNQWGFNLTTLGTGAIAIGDINRDNFTDIILTGDITGPAGPYAKVYINNGTSLNENITWEWNLTGISETSLDLQDIDNDGDLDLVMLNGHVYLNNGTSFVDSSQWSWNLTGGLSSTLILRDINNDGRLDLIVGNPKFRIYLNNGTSFNENMNWEKNIQEGLSTGTGDGRTECIDLGDYDNDGDLDIAVAGHDGGDPRNKFFKNNGTSFVLDQNNNGINSCDISFGDINNDGSLDLIEMGAFFAVSGAYIFITDNGTLTYNSTWTSGLSNKEGGLALGDYNNDGKLDLQWTGNYISKVYNNTGIGFTQDTIFDVNFTGISYSSTAWIDIDNDGDLDAILIGYLGSDTYLTKIYISNASLYKNNSLPYSPSTFDNHSLANGNVFIGWNNGSDNETISLGLYYNLRVGTTSGGNQIVSGVFGSGGRGGDGGGQNGQFGNMMQRRNISISGSRFGVGTTYYWSVQTIDTGLAKSAWSTEQTFTLTSDFTPPVVTLNAPSGVTNQTMNIVFNATVYDDYNLTNVSLYGNWSGGWHVNQTNSSGINNTDYIFKANLTEGEWLFGIRACDATNNCRGTNGTFRIDITYPIVALVSPANGPSQTSSNAVTFTYNVSDVSINNCTLYLNGVKNESDTSIISNGSSQTFSENVPNGNYNWTVRCADAANNINTTSNFSLTVSYTPDTTPPSTSSGGGGGGGGGAVSAAVTKVTRIIASIAEGNNLIEFAESEKTSVGVEEILLNAAAAASNVKITIEKLAEKPASVASAPSGDIYAYLQFNKTVLKDDDVKEAKITFNVLKSWVLSKGADPEKVMLNRYTTKWEELPTTYLRQNGTYYYYESSTPGFSVFAITAEKKEASAPIKETNVTEKKEEIPIQEAQKPEEGREQKRAVWHWYALAVLLAAALIIIAVIKSKKSHRR